ncbi:MAG TPA: DUF4440 domain-containing protein [Bacteroidota bacterium]|nr:DUF4440 domain-containing protein [Bacteroidota bacterium]
MRKPMMIVVMAAIVCSVGSAQQMPRTSALDSMVATERAFAATCLKEGIRASFLKFFADSAVAFSPEPYVFRQAAAKRPAPANPLARTLHWEPVAGDVASSGDLGFLMGPSSLTDHSTQPAPVHYGFYLSVWKKQRDGSWKVVIDIGTDATETITRFFGSGFTRLGGYAFGKLDDTVDPVVARNELLGMDSTYASIVAVKDVQTAYRELLDTNAVALRQGIGPIEGRDTIIASLTINHGLRLLTPFDADASKAGDLGYTYGSYKINPEVSKPSGYYVRIWRKNADGVWKLAVEKDAPAEE